jgi:5-methylcytosine-specific restriction endonuclease McrA
VYQQNRRKRAVAAGGKLSPNIRHKLIGLQRGKCACCRADLKKIKMNLDHIMPLALGGAHSDENVQLLCQPCNNQKYSKHPVDFMQEKGFLL